MLTRSRRARRRRGTSPRPAPLGLTIAKYVLLTVAGVALFLMLSSGTLSHEQTANYLGRKTAQKRHEQKNGAHRAMERQIAASAERPPPLTRTFGNDGLKAPTAKNSRTVHEAFSVGLGSISLPKNLIKGKPLRGG